MNKSRPFSVFLLKDGTQIADCLREDTRLEAVQHVEHLPENASLYLLDSAPHTPWWVDYWGINNRNILQMSQGALILLPVGERLFALSYGHVSHNLNEDALEYDFGIRTTLNAVDPKKLKSTDVVDPGTSPRQRIQSASDNELTFFDFDRDSEVVRSLSGKVRDEYAETFKHTTGTTGLHFASSCKVDDVVDLCSTLLGIYEKEDYKSSFPDIHNVAPIRNPALIAQLDEEILAEFRDGSIALALTIPTIIDYSVSPFICFKGLGVSEVYDNISLIHYTNYLAQHNTAIDSIGIETLKKHRLVLCDEEGRSKEDFSIYKSLILDAQLEGSESDFHLCEGRWYEVDRSFLNRIETELAEHIFPSVLPIYNHESEAAYNSAVSEPSSGYLCLDQTNISPRRGQQAEPCDLLSADGNIPTFHHVKVSTRSSTLSHLFNQGTVSIELLRSEDESVRRLTSLISLRAPVSFANELNSAIETRNAKVHYSIVTRKDPNGGPKNFPLFSRISLYRAIRFLKVVGVEARVSFVPDESPVKLGKKKNRKKRGSRVEGVVEVEHEDDLE